MFKPREIYRKFSQGNGLFHFVACCYEVLECSIRLPRPCWFVPESLPIHFHSNGGCWMVCTTSEALSHPIHITLQHITHKLASNGRRCWCVSVYMNSSLSLNSAHTSASSFISLPFPSPLCNVVHVETLISPPLKLQRINTWQWQSLKQIIAAVRFINKSKE